MVRGRLGVVLGLLALLLVFCVGRAKKLRRWTYPRCVSSANKEKFGVPLTVNFSIKPASCTHGIELMRCYAACVLCLLPSSMRAVCRLRKRNLPTVVDVDVGNTNNPLKGRVQYRRTTCCADNIIAVLL